MTPDQFHLFANVLPELMLLATSNGQLLAANQAAERQLGIRSATLKGRALRNFVHGTDEEFNRYLTMCARSRNFVLGSMTLRLHDAEAMPCRAEGALLVPREADRPAIIMIRLTPRQSATGQFIALNQRIADLAKEIQRRRAAEEAAVHQRERLRVTLHSIGDGVVVTDLEGRVTSLNPIAEHLTGWTSDEATGQPLEKIFKIVNETTRQVVENPALRALREGMIVGLANHTILIAKDGDERPIDDSAAPIQNERGETVGVVLVFRDVTERKRVEHADRKHAEVFRLVHQIGKIGHWEWNAATDHNDWSPEIEALYGLEPGTFEGGYEGWAKLLHPDDVAKAAAEVRRALEIGEYFTEFRTIWPDGSIHWLETRAKVFKDQDGKPIRIVGVNMDITERRRQVEALRLSEQRWRTMAEALPNLLWTDLPNGECDWLSSQWRDYTGLPEEELLGTQWLDKVLHPDDRARTLACWQTACADLGDYDLEYRIRRHDGQYRWFKTRGVPIRNEAGAITYWFGTCTDVEDFKQLEENLRDNDRRKDEFLATLAHELRNPLAPIRNGFQIIKLSRNDPSTMDQVHSMMERQLDHMIRLIDDLLDISRVSRGKIEIRKAHVPLQTILNQAMETSRPLIESNSHQLLTEIPEEPIFIDADVVRLTQVFANILNNAAKYTPTGGRIALTVRPQEPFVTATIKDNGVGIPPNMLGRVFEMFTQVDRSLERSQSGLGIGLTIVKRLVELHAGHVEARSEGEGLGCEFVVRLPIIKSPTLPLDPGARSNENIVGKRRILVVDDNRDSATTLEMMLKMMGNEVRKAHDGQEAIALGSEYHPELILMDVGMPKLNGLDATRLIRALPWGKCIYIVALSGWGQEEDRRKTREAGCDGHLVKPIQLSALRQLLEGLPANDGH